MNPIYVVDAFTSEAFRGNPAGVCLLEGPVPSEWMLNVAAEMKHAETAFLWPLGDKWSLKWFTPTVEIALCGHATIAATQALHEHGLGAEVLRYETLSGELTARQVAGGIQLDFPALSTSLSELPGGVAEALGVTPIFVGKTRHDYLIEVATVDEVKGIVPDHAVLAKLPVRGVIVTAAGSPPYDITSRFFAPGVGVPEDPVTGSAHCALTPYWCEKLGKTSLRAYQASERGGELELELKGDRVLLTGQAVTVLKGTLLV